MEGSTTKNGKGGGDRDHLERRHDKKSMQIYFQRAYYERFARYKIPIYLLINQKIIYIAGFKFYSLSKKISLHQAVVISMGAS